MKRAFVFYASITVVIFILFTVFILLPRTTFRHIANASPLPYPANIELDGDNPYGTSSAQALASPNIMATDIRLDWVDVEPQKGIFNWAPLDQEMHDWVTNGKKYTLIVRFVHESFSGSCSGNAQYLPLWEVQKLQAKNLVFCSQGGAYIPDYFDQTFQSDFFAYLTAIEQHIQQSPYKDSLLYVRIGLGAGGEGFPCLGCSQSDNNQLASWGLHSPTDWKNWQEFMLTTYQQLFPSTTLIYGLGYHDIDPQTQTPVDQEVALFALQKGMGIGQEGLNPKPRYMNEITFFEKMRSLYPNAYMQFGTVFQVKDSINPPICYTAECVVQTDIQQANAAGAFSIEWYPQDAGNNTFQTDFALWQQMVNNRTGTISPSPPFSPTPSQPPTVFSLTLCPHGLGSCGDNISSSSGNTTPLHPQRTITLTLFDSNNKQVAQQQGQVTYTPQTQNFQGTVNVSLSSGSYIVGIKMDGFLEKQLPGLIAVTPGQQVSLPVTYLVNGDINNDNQLDIQDFNTLISCYGEKVTTPSCLYPPTKESPGADLLDDDGQVDGGDYNLFLRELSVQKGQ